MKRRKSCKTIGKNKIEKEIIMNKFLKTVFCLLFSAFETIGILLYKYCTLDVSKFSYGWCEILSTYLCIATLSYVLISYLVAFIFKTTKIAAQTSTVENGTKHSVGFLAWGIIASVWLIWVIAYYPGSPFWDMSYQLAQYYGLQKLNLHPPFSTLVMGLCMDIGQSLFASDNIGFFLYILLQFFVLSFACLKSCLLILEITNNVKICIIASIFYAFFPLFGATVQSGMKDTISFGLSLLAMVYIYILFRELRINNKISVKNFVEAVLVAFLGCLYRKEMVYLYVAVIIAFAIYAVSSKQNEKTLVVYTLTALLVVGLSGPFANNVIIRGYFGQEPSSQDAESISIPLQHVARCVTFHEDVLTENDKQVIGECFSYGYEGIKNNYNPNLSDPIKYNFSPQIAKMNGFWDVYMRLLKQRPFLFVESVLASGYGYFSIVPNVPATINDAPTNGLPGSRIPNLFINDFSGDRETQGYKTEYSPKTEKLREFLNNYTYSFQVPYNLLYSFGFYTWLIILLFIISVQTKGWSVVVYYLLPALLILVCIASPVNDYIRYYMGIIYIVPILVGDAFASACRGPAGIKHTTE